MRPGPRCLGRLAELMAPGGTIALTLVDETTLLSAGAASTQILPDMRELDGWVYSSEPLWVQVGDEALTVRRLRERVSPDGELSGPSTTTSSSGSAPRRLEHEAEEPGLRPAGRRQISPARPRPTRRSSCWRCRRECGAPPARALPRADEHLRGPRQHPVPAAPLRVARDRLRLRRCGPGRAGSTPPSTT